MVQLSVQDVTQESKVGVRTALVQNKGEQASPALRCLLVSEHMGMVLCHPPQATYSTNCPVWEEAFRFFLQDPRSQELDVQVRAALS